MAIYDEAWVIVSASSPDPPDWAAHTVTLRWQDSVNVKAQAGISAFGSRGFCALGFMGYVQSGQHRDIYPPAPVFFMDDITELDVMALCYQSWVEGGATVMLWD